MYATTVHKQEQEAKSTSPVSSRKGNECVVPTIQMNQKDSGRSRTKEKELIPSVLLLLNLLG
jgi:hypothetical protein